MFSPPLDPANPSILRRFWAKVDRSGGDDACWLWLGAVRRPRGEVPYGVFRVSPPVYGEHRRQVIVYAHRFALVLATGIEPLDLDACHNDDLCTSSLCCNDRHLRWGTKEENRVDTLRKYGRGGYAQSDADVMAAVLDDLERDGVIS